MTIYVNYDFVFVYVKMSKPKEKEYLETVTERYKKIIE